MRALLCERDRVMGGLLSDILHALLPMGALAVLADAFAAPRGSGLAGGRRASGLAALLLATLTGFGLLLILTGSPIVAAAGVVILIGALSLISNIKRRVLGEPLVFSDFALLGAVFRHPQFYLSALRPWQVVVLAGGLIGLGGTLVLLSNAAVAPRLAGAGLALGAGTVLAMALARLVRAGFAEVPDPDADVARLGLLPCLLAHWRFWCVSSDPLPCDATPITGDRHQLVVIVQCESFTDPAELFGDPALALPGLERARAMAWQSGRLAVSGFGAYTMRTEYGVLFGLPEERLGMRRFDPFLTAKREASWALPNRLDHGSWDRWFVHPHDMRFYGRNRLMPASGFATLVGQEFFPKPGPGEGRYVTDAAMTDQILALAQDGERAGLIYAVTIENHGPWPAEQGDEKKLIAPYLRLLANSDAMLTRLLDELPRLGRPVTFCFFGDHRPSIPRASEPGAERHTPYVLLRFAANGKAITGSGTARDLAPAMLHHAILDAIRLGQAKG